MIILGATSHDLGEELDGVVETPGVGGDFVSPGHLEAALSLPLKASQSSAVVHRSHRRYRPSCSPVSTAKRVRRSADLRHTIREVPLSTIED
jgi:hypothetical protein